ncbi:DUF58 domain-containing protein [Celerinatantimonas diazotrophica]|uniref:Uncharacterized protein DUF58 n=1 Tax=Celerinatantimonas diazotrophica TaxID=412034 RepID=A0A4R1KK27_9GAMM|nr:DUF58 domain-containing protein [Celerinatantimonas diazotrophica]TCK64019.1 uncharacterized protein DUF58 [Celerinatantimonas diazotrophica]CAG9297110.1 hypothetical protein CEDIAZO_02278 [Celerinatantimonas diazotrophica]
MYQLQRPSPIELSFDQLLDCRLIHFKSLRRNELTLSQQAGHLLSRYRGSGMEFDEVRQYQAGDDIRHIDWRVTARTGKTHSKVFREERDRPVVIAVDLNASMFFGSGNKIKAMMACELAAIIGWSTIDKHQRTALQLLGQHPEYTDLVHTRSNWLALLQRLCESYQQQLNQLSEIELKVHNLQDLLMHLPTGASVHIISDFYHYNETELSYLQQGMKHHLITLWQITDPLEFDLPDNQFESLAVIQNQQQGILPLAQKSFVQKYRQLAMQRQDHLNHIFSKYRLASHSLSTAKEWHDYF